MYLCDKSMSFKFLLSTVLLTIYSINNASAGFGTDCALEGLDDVHWLMGYTINPPINDTHRGFVASFKTVNIKSMTVKNKKYLNASWENSELRIFTTDAFENFEEEAQAARTETIRIEFKFDCNKGGSDSLTMSQRILDINNHDPTFSKEIYEYNFGMTIPEKFDLTQIFPISASDGDFTNFKISFSFKETPSKNFQLQPNRNMISKYHHASLKTITNLTTPFREEFDIVATDDGKPSISKTAKVIITVDYIFNEEAKKQIPYFSKNLYYGNYSLNNEVQTDIIAFKETMLNDVTIRQSGYENNFKIYYDAVHKEVKVDVIQPLSSQDLLNDNFITIEIEAHVEELNLRSNTVLMMSIPKTDNTITNEKEKFNNCFISFPNSSHNFNILPTIIYLAIVIVLVFCTMVLILIYRKDQITRSETFQIPNTPKIDELYITK